MNSLRLKLVGWYLLILGCVLISFSLMLYFNKQSALMDGVDSNLKTYGLEINGHLEVVENKVQVMEFPTDSVTRYVPLSWSVRTSDGEPLQSYSRGSSVDYHSDLDYQVSPVFETIHTDAHSSSRLMRMKVAYQEDSDENQTNPVYDVRIDCLESLQGVYDALKDLRGRLITWGVLTFLVAALGGYFLAGQVLRPIERISRVVAGISDKELKQRIDETQFDRELHPLIRQLNEAFARLDSSFQRERQFTSDASHELRTPLSVIINNIEVLLKRPRSLEEHVDVQQSNLETSLQMQTMVEELLVLSRMDAGQVTLQRKDIPLADIITVLFREVQHKADVKTIQLINQVPAEFLVHVDVDKFKQVIRNLLENGIQYNHDGGNVRVSAQRTPNELIIEIADSGVGIPVVMQSRIFERFYRVDSSRASSTGGAGLGLSIAKSIVELHQGTIRVTSDNQGSIFIISLPGS
jgi:heavy metal sensor kinase